MEKRRERMMKNIFRKTVSLLLGATLAVSSLGCGSTEETTIPQESTATAAGTRGLVYKQA